MSLAAFRSSAVDSTIVEELPEGMEILDDFDLPSLDDLLQHFPDTSDPCLFDKNFQPTQSCRGHTSHCSQTSVGHSAQVSRVPGQCSLSWPEEKGGCVASGNSAVPFTSPDSSGCLDHGEQPAESAQASLSQHQIEKPTSSNESTPPEEGPQSSSDRDGGHKRRRMGEADAASSGEQEDGGACSPEKPRNEGSRAGSPVGNGSEDEQKKQARMQRNRESAMQSRQRRKMQLEELERRNAELQTQNTHLTGLVANLSAENAALRHQLAAVQGSGCAAPAMPVQPGSVPVPARVPMPYVPWMPGMPFIGATPKVPIQRLPLTRPEPANGTAARARKGDTKKRARAAAGSTALLALFCFFVFVGPMSLWPGNNSVPASRGSVPMQNSFIALPSPDHARAGGRVLQSLQEDFATESNWTSGPHFGERMNTSTAGVFDALKEADGSALDLHKANAALVLRSNAQTKASALQRLKDLGPVTLYSDWGSDGGVSKVWEKTGGVIRTGRPLMPPMQCREVFSLDASQNSDLSFARGQLQKYVATPSLRRALTGGPLAMPPASHHGPAEEETEHSKFSRKIGCEDSDEDVVVSIMLPAQQPEEGNKSVSSLDEVFVVVVKPMKKYVTYACSLQNPILV